MSCAAATLVLVAVSARTVKSLFGGRVAISNYFITKKGERKMQIYQVTFDFKNDEFNESNLVYEESAEKALLRAWNNLRYPCDKEDISKYGTVEICKYSDELQSVIEGITKPFVFNLCNTKIAEILREKGWSSEGELSCVSCGLYPNGLEEYELDDDGYCPDCQDAEANNV